jgi:hypothetical protein
MKMRGATLYVSRTSVGKLRFVLQLGQAPSPRVLAASTFLRLEQRKHISYAFQDFAECLRGFHADEPRFRELGQVLFSVVLPQSIREQLYDLEEPLAIQTDDPTLPWEILHDGKEFLALKFPLARQLIIDDKRMPSPLRLPEITRPGFSALVIADPTGDLPGAREEGKALCDFFKEKGTCDLLLDSEATWQSIHRRLVGKAYSIIHLCGHVDYDPSKRQSSIRLREGRLSAGEVSTFRGRPIVFLNACYSDLCVQAQAASARAASFAREFIIGNEKGVASAVVGTMWRIPDEPEEAGREFSMAFYRFLLEGGSIGEAMRVSRAMARGMRWGPMVWSPYVLYADPCLVPFKDRAARTATIEGRHVGSTNGAEPRVTKLLA